MAVSYLYSHRGVAHEGRVAISVILSQSGAMALGCIFILKEKKLCENY